MPVLRFYKNVSFLSVVFLIFIMCAPAIAQGIGIDASAVKSLEQAAKTGNVEYILGFITIASMGLSWWTIQKRDQLNDTIQKLVDLEAAKSERNEVVIANINKNLQEMKDKPCLMTYKEFKDKIK
jgi:negative regulator of sigma E activity